MDHLPDQMAEFLPKLLIVVGVFLQFMVRARKKSDERVYILWAVGLCTAVYVLVSWPFIEPANVAIVRWMVWLGDPTDGALIRVLAGTTLTSIGANMAVKYGGQSANNPAMPVTNSK